MSQAVNAAASNDTFLWMFFVLIKKEIVEMKGLPKGATQEA